MTLTRYRAVAVDVEIDGHPVQCITSSLNDVADWTHKTQDKHKCAVDIYVTEERLLRREEPVKDA
jgi:hypothetical protein